MYTNQVGKTNNNDTNAVVARLGELGDFLQVYARGFAAAKKEKKAKKAKKKKEEEEEEEAEEKTEETEEEKAEKKTEEKEEEEEEAMEDAVVFTLTE
ncbi:unnamed protein product [Aspergillus oryzae]|nr:unnamed protein product [Aspergillus oryzae]